ncbi:DUF4401 domain-containing protein [Aureispira anguillae]|uniref:DUF4401 domain-containing protein n=1 Tax=Aureispira anguillae TaxID=2864201 RepID=A0A915YBL1_9BACT|nr:DUF4401 domain-containing protein [Aureispira anguillae]BDS10080.1 DUF4401 domain-containing protein [Aureispira anguillae]
MSKKNKMGLVDLLEWYKEEGINPKLNTKAFQREYHDSAAKKTPILVQVLMFIGSILGAIFFLGFMALSEVFQSEIFILITGLIIAIVGLTIPYQSKQEATAEPVGMALLIVGCTLFTIGFISYGNNSFFTFLILSLITSIIVVVIAGSHLQKISAVLCANLCAYWLIWEMNWGVGYNFLVLLNASIATIAWLKEPQILAQQSRLGQWYAAILNGCSISMIAVLVGSVNIYQNYHWDGVTINPSYWWLSSILLVALVLWTLSETLDRVGEKNKKIPILLGAGIALLVLIQAPGIVAGILLLFLGVYSSYYLFAGQGILAIFFFTGMFYYNMETTLLLKSILMVSAGLIFLALGYGIKRVYDQDRTLNSTL